MAGSIRTRLLLGTGIGVGIAFVVSGILVHVLARASLYAQFDESLEASARAMSLLVEFDDEDGLEHDLVREARPGEYFELWDGAGTSIVRSTSVGEGHLLRGGGERVVEIVDVTLPGGGASRQAVLVFAPRHEVNETTVQSERPLVMLAVARSTADVETTVGRLTRVLIVVGVIATLLCVGVLLWIVRFGLAPVRELATDIAALRAENLGARLDTAKTPRELAPIVERLNDLLKRLQGAFDRERELTAEVAHELRTPLAGLRANIEVALDRERTPERYRTTLADCLTICTQTERMVESMLSLAKLDAGMVSPRREAVELDELVREVIAPLSARAADRELAIATELAPVTAQTDREKLKIVIHNLLDNAVTYADARGTIRVEVSANTIRVANTGCTLTSEKVAHVFDRFWRGDTAREAGAHAGLGLALCRKLVELLGGTITAEVTNGRFVATVVLKPPA